MEPNSVASEASALKTASQAATSERKSPFQSLIYLSRQKLSSKSSTRSRPNVKTKTKEWLALATISSMSLSYRCPSLLACEQAHSNQSRSLKKVKLTSLQHLITIEGRHSLLEWVISAQISRARKARVDACRVKSVKQRNSRSCKTKATRRIDFQSTSMLLMREAQLRATVLSKSYILNKSSHCLVQKPLVSQKLSRLQRAPRWASIRR